MPSTATCSNGYFDRPDLLGQASNDIEYIKQKSGGNLKGVKVAFLYVDYPLDRSRSDFEDAGREGRLRPAALPYPLPGKRSGLGLDPDPPLQSGLDRQLEPVEHARDRLARNEAHGIPIDKYIAVN